jgi:hypothetical protein
MRKLSIAAIVVASLAVVLSGTALWRARDIHSGKAASTPAPKAAPAPALVSVPNEVLKQAIVAGGELLKLKLKFKVTMAPSVSTPKQKVMSQNPAPGTKVPVGSEVQLTVSSGPV